MDNCIKLIKADGKQDKCCDGVLLCNSIIIFVELTTRTDIKWRKEKENQLRTTIRYFEDTEKSDNYEIKKAYIANSKHPRFSHGQDARINGFFKDTGYVLRINNRVSIEFVK